VLQVIAEFTGLNIVTSDSVTGNITLRLKDVPWDQALDLILQTKGLDQRRNGNIINIAPREELLNRDKQILEGSNSSMPWSPSARKPLSCVTARPRTSRRFWMAAPPLPAPGTSGNGGGTGLLSSRQFHDRPENHPDHQRHPDRHRQDPRPGDQDRHSGQAGAD
jgi:type IV pilus assembly protein PilQ